jgi:hypothetical protein
MLKLILLLSLFSAMAIYAQEDSFETAGLKNRMNSASGVIGLQDDNTTRSYSPWAVTFFSLASMDQTLLKENNPQVFTYNYFGVNYRLNFNEQVSFRPAFLYKSAGTNSFGDHEGGGVEIHDAYFQYANFNLMRLPFNIGSIGQFRWYFPTGEGSKKSKTVGRLGAWLIFQKPLVNGFQINYNFRPDYYFQSTRASLNEFTYSDGSPGANIRGNRRYKIEHYLELGKVFNTTWASTMRLGQTYESFFDSPANDIEGFNREQTNLNLGLRYTHSFHLSFIFTINNDIVTTNAKYPFKIGREEELSYALLTFVRF